MVEGQNPDETEKQRLITDLPVKYYFDPDVLLRVAQPSPITLARLRGEELWKSGLTLFSSHISDWNEVTEDDSVC